jgi:pimeloyl-ACP methyl ester carboxylesterase
MSMIRANNVQLHIRSLGEGPLLVMCHGLLFANMATWYFSAAAALARHYRVVLYDQRGHGNSEWTRSGYDPDTMALDLSAVIDHSHTSMPEAPCGGSRKVTLVGHSYGALVALRYALFHRTKIHRLVLIDAPLPAARYVYPSLSGIHSMADLTIRFSRHMHSVASRNRREAKRLQQRLEFLLLQSSLARDVAAAGDIADLQLRQLDIPVLCLYGRRSDCCAAGERLAGLLPQGELRWLDCGHYVTTEAPGAMTQELIDYLRPR